MSKTGCISLKDYINICEDHGMHLDEEDLELITALVNDYGKVKKFPAHPFRFFFFKLSNILVFLFLDIKKRLLLSC